MFVRNQAVEHSNSEVKRNWIEQKRANEEVQQKYKAQQAHYKALEDLPPELMDASDDEDTLSF